MTAPEPGSSELDDAADASLAVLLACHHRGPLAASEIAVLLSLADPPVAALERLASEGLLESRGERFAVTPAGRIHLDGVLEAIEAQLAPDDPAYVRRYRREAPVLPFDATTTWAQALCVNVRVDPAALRPLVPEALELDLHGGWGWVSLLASRLKDFGAGPIGPLFRMNFYQATYRAHVVYRDFRGQRRRGCFFLRSETNSRLMSFTANCLPEFRHHHCSTYPIFMASHGDHLVLSVDSGLDPSGKVVLVLDASRPLESMPAGSAFESLDSARKFLVDIWDAFAWEPETREILVLSIDRGEWRVRVLAPVDAYLGFFDAGPFDARTASLDSVFYFTDVPYRWLPLVRERIRT